MEGFTMNSPSSQSRVESKPSKLQVGWPYTDSECKFKISPDVANQHGELCDDIFRLMKLNYDDGTEESWYACRGIRVYSQTRVPSLPYILAIDCSASINSKEERVDPPTRLLILGDSEYHLAAVLFGNNKHFVCTVMIQGKTAFYDGMRMPLVRWVSADFIPLGYRIHIVWYLKKSAQDCPSTADSLKNGMTEDAPERVPREEGTVLEGEPSIPKKLETEINDAHEERALWEPEPGTNTTCEERTPWELEHEINTLLGT